MPISALSPSAITPFAITPSIRIVPESLYKQLFRAPLNFLTTCFKSLHIWLVKRALTSGKSLAVSVLNITVVTYLALFLDEILICLLLNIYALVPTKNRSHNVTSLKKRHIFNHLDVVTQILTPKMAIVLLSDLAVI
ncbi:hypothetical protein [Vibrio splendidus]|uniref:hypothetical protein n=1 Tax=Vibrio splendidus TaxID=29497 RepID=UPI000C8605D3|nr:hypothetical protein [Vibrio splendidus]PMJ61732.1 hypothetical protein BCU23_20590 [Vibrio splendidus]